MATDVWTLLRNALLHSHETIVRKLLRHNILYLVSALLMLVGCYMVCIPYLFHHRDFGGLLSLLGTINVYELMVLGAGAFILRRAPKSPEGAVLIFVQLLFLLDITFTVNACLPLNAKWGAVVLVGSLLGAIAKGFLLEWISGRPIFSGLRQFLIPAIVFAHSFQWALTQMSDLVATHRQAISFGLWFVLGALPLLLHSKSLGDESDDSAPAWKRPTFRGLLILATMTVLVLQLAGQSWVHRAPFRIEFLLPLIVSLFAVLPLLFPKADPSSIDISRYIFLPAVFMIALMERQSPWYLRDVEDVLPLTPVRLTLVFSAVAAVTVWLRERRVIHLHAAFATLFLAIAGYDWYSMMVSFLHHANVELVTATSILMVGWFAATRPGYAEALIVATLWLRIASNLPPVWEGFNGRAELFRYWPLMAMLLTWGMGVRTLAWRWLLVATVFVLGVRAGVRTEFSDVVYFWAAGGAFMLGMMMDVKAYLVLMALYLFATAGARMGGSAERPDINWGWVVIGVAFVVMGLAVAVTRRALAQATPETSPPSEARD